jgi:hypothetical protein
VRKRKTLLAIALVTLALLASACPKRAVVKDSKGIRGWAEGEGYQWIEGPDEIRTEQAFFDYINGAAQPIIDLGWKRSLYGVLTRDKSRLRLTLHEMLDSKAAAALLAENAFKDTQPIAVGDRAVYWDRGAFSKGILFQKENVVCELTFEKEGNKDKLLGLASSLETLTE